jgi:hypothetical protein
MAIFIQKIMNHILVYLICLHLSMVDDSTPYTWTTNLKLLTYKTHTCWKNTYKTYIQNEKNKKQKKDIKAHLENKINLKFHVSFPSLAQKQR